MCVTVDGGGGETAERALVGRVLLVYMYCSAHIHSVPLVQTMENIGTNILPMSIDGMGQLSLPVKRLSALFSMTQKA